MDFGDYLMIRTTQKTVAFQAQLLKTVVALIINILFFLSLFIGSGVTSVIKKIIKNKDQDSTFLKFLNSKVSKAVIGFAILILIDYVTKL